METNQISHCPIIKHLNDTMADDLVMTIASDEELPTDGDFTSEDEMEQTMTIPKNKSKSKSQVLKKKSAQSMQLLADNFEFDDDDNFTAPVGSSWDFTKAIERINQMEGGVQKGTSIQAKVDKRRQEIAAAKKVKKESKDMKKKKDHEEVEVNSNSSESESNSDSDTNANSEENQSEEENDQHIDQEDIVEEENRLQSALKERKNIQSTIDEELDTEEIAKAKEFYAEEDEYAAAEFESSKFATFTSFKLSRPIMRAITQLGFTTPTPIQQRAIPIALTGKDICANAQTGSGKTAAFLLPILERLQFRSRRAQSTRVLIIAPVRELATQCQSMLEQLAKFTDITSALAVGGLPLQAQEAELRLRPDVVICTPGRMIDHLRNSKSIHLDDLEILVLDEADRLLEMGFAEEVNELVSMCPVARQTLLFSATLTSKVDQLIALSMKRPVRVRVDPIFDMAKHLVQEFVRIRPSREDDREAILLALCTRTFKKNTIVFMETKAQAHRMRILFGLAGISAAELHGNLQQRERLEALQQFRDGSVDILLCTDIAARGIDIKGVHAVINYEMPKDLTTYVHRVGRTARAGRNGRAVTLTSESRRLVMKQVVRNCKGFVKARAVPDAVIQQWKARTAALADDVKAVMHEDTLEKRLREAEKEATRAQNLLVHQKEIEARPARTWFLTAKEKKNIETAAEEHRKGVLAEREEKEIAMKSSKKNKHSKEPAETNEDKISRAKKMKSLTHKKRRIAEIRDQEERLLNDERSNDTDAPENKNKRQKGSNVFTSEHVAGAAKFAKKNSNLKQREREEASIADITEMKRLKQEKARQKQSSHKTNSSGFDIDMSAQKTQTLSTTSRKDNQFEFKEKITDYKKHAKRHASGKFKSKSKYRRR